MGHSISYRAQHQSIVVSRDLGHKVSELACLCVLSRRLIRQFANQHGVNFDRFYDLQHQILTTFIKAQGISREQMVQALASIDTAAGNSASFPEMR